MKEGKTYRRGEDMKANKVYKYPLFVGVDRWSAIGRFVCMCMYASCIMPYVCMLLYVCMYTICM